METISHTLAPLAIIVFVAFVTVKLLEVVVPFMIRRVEEQVLNTENNFQAKICQLYLEYLHKTSSETKYYTS